jgi:subfamily B ATP-binding cassette protein MsbA
MFERYFSYSLRRFLQYSKPYWLLMTGATLAGVFKFSLALSLPVALGYVIDDILPHLESIFKDPEAEVALMDFEPLFMMLGLLVLAFVMRGFATYARSVWTVKAGQRTIFDLRRDLFRHVQRLSLLYHSERRTGETTSRLINDMNATQGIVNQGIVAMTMDIIFLHGVIIFLFVWEPLLAAVSLFTLPIYAVLFRAVNPRLREAAREVQEEMEEMSGEVTEKIAGLPVVISHVREKTEELNFFQRHKVYYRKVLHRTKLRMFLTSVAEFLQSFGPIVVISFGAYRVATTDFTAGNLVTFYGFLAHLYLPTRRLADYSALLQERLAALDRVFEVLDSEPDIQDDDGAEVLKKVKGRIRFENVNFCYKQDGEHVLEDINLDIEPGQSVAFVGRSGAGKTTLVNLVPRFYDVTQGVVRIDGRDVRNYTVRSLRDHIGFVLQDSILFSGTIRENICYGKRGATEEAMVHAAEMAHAAEFINEMPDGYDTVVGERGVSLSGGQKQRISIARAFLRDPRILILDEATSNLDSGAEQVIQDALRNLMTGRTTLVIAHRLSTIVDCDKVVVLQEGRMVQEGSHSELVMQPGVYRKLCKEQFGGVNIEEIARMAG